MNSNCLLVLKLSDEIPSVSADIIGVDKGSLFLAQKGIRMKAAIGDFDSIDEYQLETVRDFADQVIKLNPIKDDTDSEAAVMEAIRLGYQKIYLVGGTGGRLDHELVNIRLCEKFPGRVILLDSKNYIEALLPGTYEFGNSDYHYISFMCREPSLITLRGMKYNLERVVLKPEDIYAVSNEISEDTGIINIESGKILMIRSND